MAAATGRAKQWKGKSPCDPAFEAIQAPWLNGAGGRARFYFGVGLNYVSQPQNALPSCWNDVETLHRELEGRYGVFANTWLLTDRPKPAAAKVRAGLTNRAAGRKPTRSVFLETWSEVLREAANAGHGAEIVFAYSGHGSFRLTVDPHELYGQSDCIILLDDFVWDYEILARMVKPLPLSSRLLIVLDSCNSGSAANLPWTFNPLSETVNQTSQHTALPQDVIMISGCRDEQTSAAGQGPEDLSECTRVLVESLRGRPAGTVPVSDLVVGMRRLLVAARDTQIPQLSLSRPPLLGALL